ncbi:hypothetical protein Clacol_006111 [Clathrus columnatus]|uniref:Cell division control protein 73 C-terminal domain-containing protein n=1 Tax=Clathrus columnatus TaxID=1419009 RepID=A0AAV5AFG3_9AGAM|nr:hypothetical protein Clacol_006111 [Clathrus columnatus]
MASDDALLALQNAIRSNFKITYSNESDEEVLALSQATRLKLSPSLTLPKSTPTRFRKLSSTATDPTTSPNDFITLEAVLLAWLGRDTSAAEYMKQVRETGLLTFVSITERKGVIDWLEGKVPEHERIVPLATESTTPPGTPPPQLVRNGALPSAASATPSKRRYVADTSDLEAVKKLKKEEIELKDRTTVLRGTKPNNFASVKGIIGERLKKLREPSKTGSSAATQQPRMDPKLVAKKAKNNFPIIIISSSPTSLITMHNVKRFLQDAVFEPSSEARARAAAEGNSRAEDMIPIYRKRTHVDPSGKETETRLRYFIVDGVDALKKFGDDAWDRVICVMTTGQAWQFRPYKWSEPRQLFHHVKGVHVAWTNDPPNSKIKDWNVSEMRVSFTAKWKRRIRTDPIRQIDPHRRHVDKSVVAHFWKMLDTWTMTNKPWLMSG